MDLPNTSNIFIQPYRLFPKAYGDFTEMYIPWLRDLYTILILKYFMFLNFEKLLCSS